MIRAALKIACLYFLAWVISTQWEALNDAVRFVLDSVVSALPLEATSAAIAGLCVVSLAMQLALVPLWLAWVRLDRRTGQVRSRLPRRPLRVLLSFRVKWFLSLFALEMLLLMVMLRALEAVVAPASVVGPAFLSGGGQDTLWIAYGSAHAVVAVLGWVALTVFARLAARREGMGLGFVQYHAEAVPVPRAFVRILWFAVFPISITAALSHAHPLHAWAIVSWLIGLSAMALLAQAITLKVERRRDRWLRQLSARRSTDWAVRERVLGALHPDRTELLGSGPPAPQQSEEALAHAAPDDAGTAGVSGLGHGEPEARDASTRVNAAQAPATAAPRSLSDSHDAMGEDARDRAASGGEWTWLTRAATGAAAVLVLGIALITIWAWLSLPSAEETRRLATSAHIHVAKVAGTNAAQVRLLGTRYDYSLNTRLDSVSEHFLNAVVASEDHRFYSHGAGYKIAKFVQAGVMCVFVKANPLASSQACRGNSTLGQQLARNLFLSEERSIRRKLRELVWAIKMEWGLSKREILSLYVNRLYLGKGNFGVEMASRAYFSKPASALSAPEAAVLAAAVKRPGWNWHQQRRAALERGELVFALMRRHGYLDASAVFPKPFLPVQGQRGVHKPYLGHLWQWIKPQVEEALSELPPGQYKVVTSLNAQVQVYAERRLAQSIARLQRRGIPATQGAVVVLRPNGEVLAMVGGTGNDVAGRGTNRAKRTEGLIPRPPASAFTPFVYLTALEQGLTPRTRVDASPVTIAVPGSTEPYRPVNHDGRTYGIIPLREGLVHSINSAAVHLLHGKVGFERLLDVCTRLGLDVCDFKRLWGLALGQSGVSPLEMASAYAVFANGGLALSAYALRALTTESGRTVWERKPPRRRRVFGPRAISALNDMLTDVVKLGTGRRARPQGAGDVVIAGKTGTGDGFVDAWFVGYTPDVIVAVWIGNDVPRAMPGVYGGTEPARTFSAVLGDLLRHTTVVERGARFQGSRRVRWGRVSGRRHR